MEVKITIDTDKLNMDVIDGIKSMFSNRIINIVVKEADATDHILSNVAYARELEQRISEYQVKTGK